MRKPEPDKPKLQWIGLDQIKADHSVQSREKMSVPDQKDFTEAMLAGDEFPAITLYFDGRYYWLADGFHRVAAAMKAREVDPKIASLKAVVHQGGKRDAMLFSAGANKKFSIKRTPEDINRAIRMVLRDKDGFMWPLSQIATHCGVAKATVRKVRNAFCIENDLVLPATIEVRSSTGNGFRKRQRSIKERVALVTTKEGDRTHEEYRACLDGKYHALGPDAEQAAERYSKILNEREDRLATLRSGLKNWLTCRGFVFRGLRGVHCVTGIVGYIGHGVIYTTADFTRERSPASAVADVLLCRKAIGNLVIAKRFTSDKTEVYEIDDIDNIRLVVVCYPEQGLSAIIELAEGLGIEFLTPEELVASIKGDEGDAATVAATPDEPDGGLSA